MFPECSCSTGLGCCLGCWRIGNHRMAESEHADSRCGKPVDRARRWVGCCSFVAGAPMRPHTIAVGLGLKPILDFNPWEPPGGGGSPHGPAPRLLAPKQPTQPPARRNFPLEQAPSRGIYPVSRIGIKRTGATPSLSPTQPTCPSGYTLDSQGNCIQNITGSPCQNGWIDAAGNCITNPAPTLDTSGQAATVQPSTCPTGYSADPTSGLCLPLSTCPTGYVTDATSGQCVQTPSWFTESTLIPGVENLWVALGGGLAAYFLFFRGKR